MTLGALVTGEFDGRPVGSPLHDWMNASLVVLEAFFVQRDHRPGRIGLVMMVAAGVGAALVGLVCHPLLVWLIVAGATLVVTPWAVRQLSGGTKAL